MPALHIPRLSIWTGRFAWSHCLSLSLTFSTNDNPRLSLSSNMSNKGFSKHGDVLQTYKSFGIAIEFLRRHSASRAGRRESHFIASPKSCILSCKTMSFALLRRAQEGHILLLHSFELIAEWILVNQIEIVCDNFKFMQIKDQTTVFACVSIILWTFCATLLLTCKTFTKEAATYKIKSIIPTNNTWFHWQSCKRQRATFIILGRYR